MIIHPAPDPIAISLGPVEVHWYGLMYLFGFIAAILLGRIRIKQSKIGWKFEEIADFVFYAAVGVFLGGRLGYVLFYNFSYYLSNPLESLAIWNGGMSFHGGLLGMIGAIWWYGKKTKRGFLSVADFVAPLVAPGLFFGRIGNFVNQELWGRVTDVSWGVWFYTVPDYPRHPSQLYEVLLEGVVLFAIVWLYSSQPKQLGRVSGVFMFWYGLFRFLVEFFREPDVQLGIIAFNWMTMGQLLSLPMVALGVYLLFIYKPLK